VANEVPEVSSSKREAGKAARAARASRFVARSRSMPAVEIREDHGGVGAILFRRLFDSGDWDGPTDFVDYTVVPPGSSVGIHGHDGNDEIYLIVSGEGTATLDGERYAVGAGDVLVTPSGHSHGLENDGTAPLVMFVVQVGHGRS